MSRFAALLPPVRSDRAGKNVVVFLLLALPTAAQMRRKLSDTQKQVVEID
jgi:hypothetical protein